VDLKFDHNEERTDLCAVNVVQCFWNFCPCLGIFVSTVTAATVQIAGFYPKRTDTSRNYR
jgi:hypothetical protein